MNRLSGAFVSFAVVFACVFLLSKQYVTPHLPSSGDISAAMNDPAFWTANWAGLVLGSVLGLFVASTVLRSRKRKGKKA
jgi:heme/copper-type cytochrome/quinol oxidase subunit 2